MPDTKELLGELFSTWDEWHYFVIGIALGMIATIILFVVIGIL